MNAQSNPYTTTRPDYGAGAESEARSRIAGDGGDHVTEDASVGTLLRQLVHEVPSLLTKELALAKSEARETLHTTKQGLTAVSTGGVVLMGGFIVLLLAAVYGLSLIVEPWLAALLVGAAVSLIGYAMVRSGQRKFQSESIKPRHTLNAVRKDTDAIRGRTS